MNNQEHKKEGPTLASSGFSDSLLLKVKPCEDDIGGSRSQDKRQFGSPSNELSAADSMELYLIEIEETLHDQKHKYSMFLEIMKDFMAQRICIDAVVKRVKELLKGHNNLILGFNTFLPDEEEEAPPKMKDLEAAKSFVHKVKIRFKHNEHVYKSFVDIVDTYQNDIKGIIKAYNEVSTLFEDHLDLLQEFTSFFLDVQEPHTAA